MYDFAGENNPLISEFKRHGDSNWVNANIPRVKLSMDNSQWLSISGYFYNVISIDTAASPCRALKIRELIICPGWLTKLLLPFLLCIISLYRHHVAAQFCPFPEIRCSMVQWRNENQPTIPKNLREIAPILLTDLWRDHLSYDMTVADKNLETSGQTKHRLEAREVEDEDGGVHVIFATLSYAQNVYDVPNLFLDATFDVVPNITRGCQLLTL